MRAVSPRAPVQYLGHTLLRQLWHSSEDVEVMHDGHAPEVEKIFA
jgi:hypothetical protein